MRQLPLITIAGTAFYVDVVNEEFREYGNDGNTISFNHLKGDGDHYLLEWNRLKKTVFQKAEHDQSELLIVRIPAMVRLDPVGLAIKYDKPLSAFMAAKDDTCW